MFWTGAQWGLDGFFKKRRLMNRRVDQSAPSAREWGWDALTYGYGQVVSTGGDPAKARRLGAGTLTFCQSSSESVSRSIEEGKIFLAFLFVTIGKNLPAAESCRPWGKALVFHSLVFI
jgi:hypothetical protein